MSESIFHLAIPCRDLDEAAAFYGDRLGCRVARRYENRITLDFHGHQLVCHHSPDAIDPEPRMYPRHFGITYARREDYDRALQTARGNGAPFFAEPFVRMEGRREEHWTFFLVDPSNNLVEFKWYRDPAMMY